MPGRSTRTRIVKDGVVYYSIGGAAKLLGTNAMTVRRLMAERQIDWLIFILTAGWSSRKRASSTTSAEPP